MTTTTRRIGQMVAVASAFLIGALLGGGREPSKAAAAPANATVNRKLVRHEVMPFKHGKPFIVTLRYKDKAGNLNKMVDAKADYWVGGKIVATWHLTADPKDNTKKHI